MRTITRRGLVGLAVSLAAVTSAVLTASPASAEAGTVTCPAGSTVITYNPPLTNQPKPTTVTLHRELGACVATRSDPNAPAITTGYVHEQSQHTLSCATPLSITGHTITQTIHWNTGETSTVSLNVLAGGTPDVAILTFTGSVTAGAFAGGTVTWVETIPALGTLLCGTTGVPSNFGTLTTQITSTA